MLDPQGRRIQWGWVQVGPPGACWRGVLTLPRVLSPGADGTLGIEPLPELARLRQRHQRWREIPLAKDAPEILTDLPSDTVEVCAEFELGAAREVGLAFGHVSPGRRQIAVVYDHQAGRLSCAERSGEFRVLSGEGRLQLRIFLDRSVVEVYANGRVALTAGGDGLGVGGGALESEGGRPVTLLARGEGALVSAVDVWEMESIWV
jgi:beta-fructofuranosidase